MYSMWFYTILVILILALVIRFMWPLLWVFFLGYLIYYIYRVYKYRQLTKQMKQAKKTFEEEWENVTSSSQYQSSSHRNDDVIDADYTVRDEKDS